MTPATGPATLSGPPAGTGPVEDPRWTTAWRDALDALELDVDRARELITTVRTGGAVPADWFAAWSPPRDLGPLPAPMAERARGLLARQHAVAAEVAVALRHSRQQAASAGRMTTSSRAAATPVYVDQAL